MRVWDLATGACTSVVDVGGEVDSLLLEGGFLFIGLHIQAAGTRQGLIKARSDGHCVKNQFGDYRTKLCRAGGCGGADRGCCCSWGSPFVRPGLQAACMYQGLVKGRSGGCDCSGHVRHGVLRSRPCGMGAAGGK